MVQYKSRMIARSVLATRLYRPISEMVFYGAGLWKTLTAVSSMDYHFKVMIREHKVAD
jgi:hypothetical protein